MAEFDSVYQRPKEGFRFKFGGIKTNSTPDSTGPDKYPYAINIRAVGDNSVQTRPGSATLFPTTTGVPVTDLRSYAALSTDNLPRFLARGADDKIWLGRPANTSTQVSTLLGAGIGPGAAMIPFRPAESPAPYMYIANGSDYQKISLSSSGPFTDTVGVQAVGIFEPRDAPGAAISLFNFVPSSPNSAYTHSGTATAPGNGTRLTDTVGGVSIDPDNQFLRSLVVSAAVYYSKNMLVTIGSQNFIVLDVFPSQPTPITIAAITYLSGSTGICAIVPQSMGGGAGVGSQSIYTQNLLSNLRRGSLIFIGGRETCYVRSVTSGPDGTVSIEVLTIQTHSAGETFVGVAAIQILGGSPTPGQAITQGMVSFTVNTGVGSIQSPPGVFPISFFVLSGTAFRSDDYLHFSIHLDNPSNLIEMKILFDVGDGSFTQNFYYYTVRANDIVAAVQNTLTQLGAAQLVSQRAIIDEEIATESRNQAKTTSGAQTDPGAQQWSEIMFPISALTRVGNDQSKSLQRVTAVQYLFNVSGTLVAFIAPLTISGGFSPDVGTNGAPYMYRVRPRSSLTGVKGNPSPSTRYGVNPRRMQVQVNLPSAAYDPQIDTWDVFRYGGSVTSWRKIGQTKSSLSTFMDIYGDDAALAGEELEFDNYQPWPSVASPLKLAAISVTGTVAIVSVPNIADVKSVLSLLPGNLVRIGSANTYTLRTRPNFSFGSLYIFQFEESAGSVIPPPFSGGVPILVYEPLVAQQRLPYMWGPDASGTVFAVGDPLRPGTLYFSKEYAPDAAPDRYNIEITPPSEPLLGGEVLDGLSFVASTERWWALYPQFQNPLQRYSVIQQPMPRGLAAPYGHCTDGKTIWWWAKDGIWSSDKGSITDADLYNLFPHESVKGQDYTYAGNTINAPDYSRCGTFRLAYSNYHLYATYQDSTGTYRSLVYDTRREAWYWDVYPNPPSVFCHSEQQKGTLLTTGTLYPVLAIGGSDGVVTQQADLKNDIFQGIIRQPIGCAIATMEWDGGDLRAGEQWGDLWLDSLPASFANAGAGYAGGILSTPMAFGAQAVASTQILQSMSRVQQPVSLGGEFISDFLGMMLTWTDDFLAQNVATKLYIWQPSLIPKPETILDRFSDWYDGETEKAKYVQGFLLHADTSNVAKGLVVRDADTLTAHAFTPAVQHNGESIQAYSFNVPFVAHLMRLEPTDSIPWRFFDVTWIFEPTPDSAETWQTQATSFGLNGYSHIQRIVAAYSSTSPVTLTITSFDGQSPQPVVLPSTGGAYQKLLVVMTANKGQLYSFKCVSASPFQIFVDDFEIIVGGWSRTGGYMTWKSLGIPHGTKALV